MGIIGAYLRFDRAEHATRPADAAVGDFEEIALPLASQDQADQASRCMNCGVAFCQTGAVMEGERHVAGCPLQNLIPETNDLLSKGRINEAADRVALTNPFPEFTGRVCPAPCEDACNLGLNMAPVTINDNERTISDHAWAKGIEPLPRPCASAPLVSIVGSGPAGLTTAWELARRGNRVKVYERSHVPGGLLTYGIPNMKLPKGVIKRRIDLMRDSGIEFLCDTDASIHAKDIAGESDAVVIAVGCGIPRDMDVPGRKLEGIHFAVEYLSEISASILSGQAPGIDARGKDVVVIGGGDTGTDCVACALRQGAKSVRQVIRAKQPPISDGKRARWPYAEKVYGQSYGQREAQEVLGSDPRIFSHDTISFVGEGHVQAVQIQELAYDGGMHLVEGTQEEIPAQLVLIAKGFIGAEREVFDAFGVDAPEKGASRYLGTGSGDAPIYAAGDSLLGASLVVSAMADSLACAQEIQDLLD